MILSSTYLWQTCSKCPHVWCDQWLWCCWSWKWHLHCEHAQWYEAWPWSWNSARGVVQISPPSLLLVLKPILHQNLTMVHCTERWTFNLLWLHSHKEQCQWCFFCSQYLQHNHCHWNKPVPMAVHFLGWVPSAILRHCCLEHTWWFYAFPSLLPHSIKDFG